jgi:hypothetical protein
MLLPLNLLLQLPAAHRANKDHLLKAKKKDPDNE